MRRIVILTLAMMLTGCAGYGEPKALPEVSECSVIDGRRWCIVDMFDELAREEEPGKWCFPRENGGEICYVF
jgi:hypothetical protein